MVLSLVCLLYVVFCQTLHENTTVEITLIFNFHMQYTVEKNKK